MKLADPDFDKPGNIDMLLGASFFWQVIKNGKYELGKDCPVLQGTKLGYIISGSVPQTTNQTHCHLLQLSEQLAKFWTIEDCQTNVILSAEEIACENHFVLNTTRDSSGRFIVEIPFKEQVDKLGESKQRAVKQFYSLERKLTSDPYLKNRYINFMNEYLSLGHMNKVENSDSISYFLPHHGVLKESSETTKLRVVFNGSAPTTTGLSLNDLQMVGPTIQSDLLSILIQFRKYTYVVSADIAMMYRQILVAPNHRSLQKIVWRTDPSKPLEEYELATVTYGTASAPFLEIRSLNQVAVENEILYPEAAKIIKNNFYVDDMITRSNNKETLIQNCQLVSNILKTGCFELRKWISNSSVVLDALTDSDGSISKRKFGEIGETKTLGMLVIRPRQT